MAGRGKPITYRLFYGGVQIERLPEEAIQKMGERLSQNKTIQRYYSEHPDKFEELLERPYVEKIPLTSESS